MAAVQAPVRPGDIVRIRGERWRVAARDCHEATAILDAEGCDATNRGACARFILPFEPVDRVALPGGPRVVRPARWRHTARRVIAAASPSWTSLRALTEARLDVVPFQLEPALAFTSGKGCRFLIADEVGLGKTIQAGMILAEILRRQPDARVLIVCPAGLQDQWHGELAARFGVDAAVFDATGVARAVASLPAGFNPWAARPVVVTSIDYLKRPEVMRGLEALLWDALVIDEAHALAGRSDRSAAALAIARRSRLVVMLTATPHSGDEAAFRRMCGIGELEGEPLVMFRRTRADAGMPSSRRTTVLRVRPTAAEAAMHRALAEYAALVWRQADTATGARLAMMVLARRACSSAASLERSVERRKILLVEPSSATVAQLQLPFAGPGSDDAEPDAVLGTPGLDDAGEEARWLERIRLLAGSAARTHEGCCHESKLALVARLVRRTTEPAIVFTEYRDTLQQLAAALPRVTAAQLHGGLTSRQRSDVLRRFTTGAARLLLATDAASEGLNLQHRCRLVINLELPWTPLRLEQRAGRVDRIGQTRRVHVVHLVADGTTEEAVLRRLGDRVERIHAAIGGGSGSTGPDTPPATPPATTSVDMRSDAMEEAARIERARRLLNATGDRPHEPRAVITAVRRRRAFRSDSVWLFRLLLTDPYGRVLWDPLVPLTGTRAMRAVRTGHSPARRGADVRTLLDPSQDVLQALLHTVRAGGLEAVRREMHTPLQLWLRREHALATALTASRARLSAGLLQLGLFDRRIERAAAAQDALLDAALSRSAARRDRLDASRDARWESCDLVLGIAFE